MKKLVLVIMLLSFPWISQAKGWNQHSKYRNNYQQRHQHHDKNYSFWKQVKHRQRSQSLQIKEGIYEGLLTDREVHKLVRQQRRVAKQIKHYKYNHHLSYADKSLVMNCLDEVSDKIMYLKQNKHYAHTRHNVHPKQNHYETSHVYNRGSHIDSSIGFHFRF